MEKYVRIWSVPFCLLILAMSSAATAGVNYADSCDILVRGGTVVDGTGAAPFAADVLVKDNTIVHIGSVDYEKLTVDKTIIATGKVVTPGFIDLHTHGDPLKAPLLNFITQGVTTVVLGQDGGSPGFSLENKLSLADWRKARDASLSAPAPGTLAGWMKLVEQHGTHTNIATVIGHGSIRYLAGVGIEPTVSDNDLSAMEEVLQHGFDSGAYGMSSGLEYVPGRFAPEEEVIHLARVVGRNDGVILSHIRSEDGYSPDPGALLVGEAIDELISQGAHARVHVSHIKIVHAKSATEADEILAKLHRAKASGIRISADVYPYLAGMSNFYFLYPVWARERSVFEDAARNDRARLASDMRDRVKWRGGPQKALITNGEFAGLNLAEIARMQNKHFEDVVIDWGYGGPQTAHFTQLEAAQDVFITADDIAIATDGGPATRHPRSFGTFAKIIQKYVVDDKLIPLEKAIYKMSGLPASVLDIDDRGRIAEGLRADILIFNPTAIVATATWREPEQFATGFDFVILNGEIAVQDDRISDDTFGQVLRKHR